MNKAYRHVYKDGIGWVAIAENGSCVSSSKGSGTVSSKTKVEVVKNFFDLRNSVVLNNGFLLKGLFAATLFCGGFVGDLRAEVSKSIQDKAVSTGGAAVYVDDGGKRFIQNKQGGYIDTEGKGLIKIRDQWYRVENYDEKGVITLSNGKKYVIPTGTLNAILHDKNYDPYMVGSRPIIDGRQVAPVFYDIEETISGTNSNRLVRYDENDKKWYVYNTSGEKLYLAKKEDGLYGLHKYSELKKNSDGVPIQDKDGYYVLSSPLSVSADEVKRGKTLEEVQNNFEKLNGTPDFNKNKPTRLGLVGLDGINTTPQKYTQDDKTNGKIPDGRKAGDNKNGTIRLGNVAKAELDDEAVNLGQLNERLKNLNTGTGKVPYVSINSKQTGTGSNYNSDGAKGKNTIAIGPSTTASGVSSTAIGESATASGGYSMAFGLNSKTEGYLATSVGYGAAAKGKQSQAIGVLTEASGASSQAIGSQSKATGEQSQAIGIGAIASGSLSQAIGSKAKSEGNQSYAIGTNSTAEKKNDIAIGSYASAKGEQSVAIGLFAQSQLLDSIAIGTKASSEKDWAIAIGSWSIAKEDNSVALGSYSQATTKALDDTTKKDVYLGDNEAVAKTVVNTKGAISVGSTIEGLDAKGNKVNPFTRQITNVAAGTKDTDAVNVAQLKTGLESKADLNAENLSNETGKVVNNTKETYADVWREKLGINDKADKSDLANLAKTDLSNITDGGKTTIKNLAKGSVEVEAADGQDIVEVAKTETTDKDTYKVSVNADKLAKNNTFITSLGNNFAKKDASNIADNKAAWETALGLGEYVKSVNSTDNFIKVDATDKQNPKLSLNTTELANDSTFVTNIAENNDFTTKLGDTFVTKTNLTGDLAKKADKDATNLADDDVEKWQKKLKINDKADKSDLTNLAKTDLSNITDGGKTTIKNLAKGSVEVVDDGKDIVKVAKTTANDKDTYTVSVNATKLASDDAFNNKFAQKDASNIADNKANWEKALGLGEYVKSVTGDKFINVNSDDKQNPKLSLNTTNLAGDKTFVTKIAENNDFTTKLGDTFITKANLSGDLAGYTRLDGSNLATIQKDKWRTALGVSDDNIKTLAQESVNVKAKDGSKVTVTDKTENGVKTFEVGVDLTGLNGTTYNFTAGENLTVEDKSGKVKYSLNKELKNITSITNEDKKSLTITAGDNKTYTFGGNNPDEETNVVTNKDLTEKGYVTADTQKTTSVSTDANSGIKVVSEATGKNTDYKLSLDETKVKEIAGTTNLTADLSKKADKDAGNLEASDITSWQNKLGINEKADKSDITNLTTNIINNGNFKSLSVSANGKTQYEIKANENIDFSGTNGINVNYDPTKNKFTFSADSSVIGGALSNKYAMLNGSNLKPANGFDQGVWRTALGLTDSNIANIFEGKNGISIKQNGNKYTITYTGTGAGAGGIAEGKVREIIKEYIGGDSIDSSKGSTDKIVTHNVSKQKTTENKNIIAAINKINKEGIGFVHVNGGKIEPEANGKSINDSSAKGENAIAIGPRSEANGKNTIALGSDSVVNGDNSGAMGYNNKIHTGADGSFAIGNNVVIEKDAKSSLALGENTKVSVAGGVALGSYSQANRKALDDTTKKDVYLFDNQAVADTVANTKGAISVGSEVGNKFTRQITGVAAGTEDSDAVNVAQLKAVQKIANQGSKWIAADNRKFDKNGKIVDNNIQAEAKGVNSVAIGAGSNTKVASNGRVVERPNTVSVGGINKDGTVTQRTLSNVAPGVLNSDAATMGQLRAGLNDVYGKLGEYKKDASAGTASALAVGNLPQATIPGKGMVSLGSGFYDGQSAMAIGLSKMSDSGKWVFKGSASYDSQEKAGAALSVGFHF